MVLSEIADIVEPFAVFIVNPDRYGEAFNALEFDSIDLPLDEQQAMIVVMTIFAF